MWVRSVRSVLTLRQIMAWDRFASVVRIVRDWYQRYRHTPLPEKHADMARSIRDRCAHCGQTGNNSRQSSFRYQATPVWRERLSRRSRSIRINCAETLPLQSEVP